MLTEWFESSAQEREGQVRAAIGRQVTKTYTVVEKDGRFCQAEVDEGNEPCDQSATLCIDLITITARGRRLMSKIGLCTAHWKRKYRQWFQLAR